MTSELKSAVDLNAENGRRQHYEPYGLLLVQLQWTRLLAALALVAVLVLGTVVFRFWKRAEHQRLVVLTPAADGSLDPLRYVDADSYRPAQKTIDHFALTFVKKYYSRIRYTIAQDYPDSLEFLAPALRQAKLADANETHWIQKFVDSNDPEVRIVVTKVRHPEHRDGPAQVSVDFEKHFYVNGREEVDQAENWTVDLPYALLPDSEISNDLIPVNPIGLSIGNLIESKGFRAP
jgi:type IV secretory pathway component VirB8